MGSRASGHRRALNVLASPEDINRSSGPFSSPMQASAPSGRMCAMRWPSGIRNSPPPSASVPAQVPPLSGHPLEKAVDGVADLLCARTAVKRRSMLIDRSVYRRLRLNVLKRRAPTSLPVSMENGVGERTAWFAACGHLRPEVRESVEPFGAAAC